MTSERHAGPSDAELFRRYARGDLSARETLALRYMPFARRLARKYRFSSEALEDLEQVACLALLKSIDRYELGRNEFVQFALPGIRGELKRHFRDRGWDVRPSRVLQERYLAVYRAQDVLAVRLGRTPTSHELAAETGLTVAELGETLEAGTARMSASLDEPRGQEEEGGVLGDTIGKIDDGFSNAEWASVLGPAFKELPERERRIVYLSLVEDRKQNDIAGQLGISQMHVSRLLRSALDQMAQAAATRS